MGAFVLPPDLLEPRPAPHALAPHATIPLPEPTAVLAGAPYYQLAEPYTHQVLVSSRDLPLQLFYLYPSAAASPDDGNADDDDDAPPPPRHAPPAASYPLMRAGSETFLSASALLWPAPGTHFVAGCKSLLAKFDASRPGGEPVLRIKTIPSERHLAKGGGVGMRGVVSALSAPPTDPLYGGGGGVGLVAAGTWTRWVGLYDFAQAGECAATWSIKSGVEATRRDGRPGIGGDGIMQTAWSPCGRYLLVSERRSKGVLVYDVRVTGELLGWLEDRDALTNQRINCDVFPGNHNSPGFEVWSGTTDGVVKVWEDVGSREGAHAPSWDWKGHGSAVGSTCLHPTGAVIATCSGTWDFPDEEEGKGEESCENSGVYERNGRLPTWMRRRNKESSLQIWGLESTAEEDIGFNHATDDG